MKTNSEAKDLGVRMMREVPYANVCSEQVTGEGPSFISVSHLLPRAICGALMGCRNIITALMHALKLSSFDLTSSVFQGGRWLWRGKSHNGNFSKHSVKIFLSRLIWASWIWNLCFSLSQFLAFVFKFYAPGSCSCCRSGDVRICLAWSFTGRSNFPLGKILHWLPSCKHLQ